MTVRWYVSPLVDVSIPDPESGETMLIKAPKVHSFIEPGRNKLYQHVSVFTLNNRCLSYVLADDWTPIEADNQCLNILEMDYSDTMFDRTLRQVGLNNAFLNRLKNRLNQFGLNGSAITLDWTIGAVLNLIARALDNRHEARNIWIRK